MAPDTEAEAPSLSETAYQRVRAQILDGTLKQGAILRERRIADAIGVSRTPLRAAVVRLEGEGLNHLQAVRDRLIEWLSRGPATRF